MTALHDIARSELVAWCEGGRSGRFPYLALEALGLPGADGCPDPRHATRRRDRLIALLMADVMRFELATAHGCLDLMPELRPGARITAKRCRHALRVMLPALERLGIAVEIDPDDPTGTALRVYRAVFSGATPAERRTLQLTAIPVGRPRRVHVHPGAAGLRDDLRADRRPARGGDRRVDPRRRDARGGRDSLGGGDAGRILAGVVARGDDAAGGVPAVPRVHRRRQRHPVAQLQAPRERLCRRPDAGRLDSPAYRSVPEIRERVLAGQPTLDTALDSAIASGRLSPDEHTALSVAMDAFETAILKWRTTHHSIVAKMLGARRGTGDTEGVAYLQQARGIPLFAGGCPFGHGARSIGAAPAEPAASPDRQLAAVQAGWVVRLR